MDSRLFTSLPKKGDLSITKNDRGITLTPIAATIYTLIIKSLNGENIKKVDDFKYLGSYIGYTEHDINIRIAKAWAALNNLNIIWK